MGLVSKHQFYDSHYFQREGILNPIKEPAERVNSLQLKQRALHYFRLKESQAQRSQSTASYHHPSNILPLFQTNIFKQFCKFDFLNR